MSNSEIHLFIIWSNALDKKDTIISDIKKHLRIKKIYQIHWSKEKFAENLTRFYGEYLPDNSEKQKHCGSGDFLAIIVEDNNPIYQTRLTSRGFNLVNSNIFDLKNKYRILTGGGHKIHATNNPKESEHDLALLLNKSCNYFKNLSPDENIEFLAQDLTGANGWASIKELFSFLNRFVDYIVLRNFECLPENYTMKEHGDIDLLVANYQEAIYLTNAKKVFDISYRVLHQIKIGSEDVLFDFRYLGDNYYDINLQKKLLKQKVLDDSGVFYKPPKELYFYTLLYHALVHKLKFSKDYQSRLLNMAKELGNIDIDLYLADPELLLFDFLEKNSFKLTRAKDFSVLFNLNIAERYTVYKNIIEVLNSGYSMQEILQKDNRFLIHYFLSKERENLISWYSFKKDASILEIDGSCGALSSFLLQKTNNLTILNPSYLESKIIKIKNSGYKVLNTQISSLNLQEKFNYIVAIGVFDYIKNHIKRLKQHLKENGVMLIALSLKHISKTEIETILKKAGFNEFNFYTVSPNYAFAQEICLLEYERCNLDTKSFIIEAKV